MAKGDVLISVMLGGLMQQCSVVKLQPLRPDTELYCGLCAILQRSPFGRPVKPTLSLQLWRTSARLQRFGDACRKTPDQRFAVLKQSDEASGGNLLDPGNDV
jgi:hypothetical protein